MAHVSRRKLAERAAGRIASGDSKKSVLRELAAYLIDSKRVREAELVVHDIEEALANRGLVVATVVSARTLSSEALQSLEAFVTKQYESTKQVVLRTQIDESLIGGVKLELPGKQLDASVKAKLEKLTV